ncbi:MAG: pilus assembly protein N-terminal domain-containing protein [Armatimonadota bacterium]|nr:pilus assembly protein N-terminal domain-containing protein [Armatimonadota bacterium]MDR7532988.1 pilus assembly protein N-terminal domain-containing protein [Armatimonadota bacterium]
MRTLLSSALILMLATIAAPVVDANETVVVQVNHGLLLKVRGAERVVVAAPEIADVNLITRNELMIIAKKVGETTLSVWDARGFTTYRILVVTGPAEDLVQVITQVLREPRLTVRVVGQVVVLEGSVKTEEDRKRAEEIARALATGRTVANALTVEQTKATEEEQRRQAAEAARRARETQLREALHGLQVTVRLLDLETAIIEGGVATQEDLRRLESIARTFVKNVTVLVRVTAPLQIRVDTTFVELDRTALQQMGVEWGGGQATDPFLTDPFAFHFGNLNQGWPLTPLQLLVARLRALEARGAARTLANPRAVVMQGRPGKLLVGGELPIPIVQADRTVTIQFKEFGIRLEFCVNSLLRKQGEQLDCVPSPGMGGGDGLTMDLRTEVSTLDFSNAIVAAGFLIPTIRKREVQTSVMLRPGEFLLLGGLIQREQSQNVQKVPLLGDIPVLGALFRSTRFQRGETELVIFVSPSVAAPTREAPPTPAEPTSSP